MPTTQRIGRPTSTHTSGLAVCVRGVARGTLTVGDTVLFVTMMQLLWGPLTGFGAYIRGVGARGVGVARCAPAVRRLCVFSRRRDGSGGGLLMHNAPHGRARYRAGQGMTPSQPSAHMSMCACTHTQHTHTHAHTNTHARPPHTHTQHAHIRMGAQVQKALIDMENMFELLATEPRTKDDPGAPPLRVTEGRVEFRDVVFGYHTTNPVLKVGGRGRVDA